MGEKNESNNQILEAIANMQKEVKNDIQNLREELINKHKDMSAAIKEIKSKQETTEEKIKDLERENKRRNLVIRGVEEREKGYIELENLVLGIINNQIKIQCTENDIDFVKRLGKKEENKARPILIGLTTWSKKIKILMNKNALKGHEIFISEDFPKDVIEKRKTLHKTMIENRKAGVYAIIKYDTLFLNGVKYVHNKESENTKKRVLEISPGSKTEEVNSINKKINDNTLRQMAATKEHVKPRPKNIIRQRTNSIGNPKDLNSSSQPNLNSWFTSEEA